MLSKPVARAEYMLHLSGQSIEESDIQLDSEFLMEMMDINEELASELQCIWKQDTGVKQNF